MTAVSKTPAEKAATLKATILNVNDDQEFRYMMGRMLQAAGFDVVEAASGEEALRLVSSNQDLVLLAVQLPDMSGFEVCRRLKNDPSTSMIPVLHLSAVHVKSRDRAQGLKDGADGYLTLPVDDDVLLATIHALLRARRATDALRASEDRHRLLAEASVVLASSLDCETTLQSVARLVVPGLADWCVLNIALEDGSLRPLAVTHADAAKEETLRELERRYPPTADFGSYGRVMRTMESVLVPEISDEEIASRARSPEQLAMIRELGPRSYMLVPLLARGRLLGIFSCASSDPTRRYGPDDLALAEDLASRAALAIDNSQLFQQEQARRTQVEAIRDVSGEIAKELELPRLLNLIIRRAAELVGADTGVIRLWDEAGRQLVPHAWIGTGGLVVERALKLGEGVAGAAAEQRKGVVVNDHAAQPWAHSDIREHHGAAAVLSQPILFGERLIGTISAAHAGAGARFSEQDEHVLGLFADQAAIAIQNAGLYEAAERRAAESLAVAQVGHAITKTLDSKEVLKLIVEHASRLFGTERSAVAVVEPDKPNSVVRVVSRKGVSERLSEHMRPCHWREGPAAAAAVRRQPVSSADILHDPAFELTPETRAAIEADGYRSVLAMPLLASGQTAGALVMYRDTGEPFSPPAIELFRVFADQAAIAIENARAFRGEQERRRQVEAIRDLAAEMTRELDLMTLLKLISQRAVELVETTSGAIFLWDRTSELLVPSAWHGFGDWVKDLRVRRGEGTAGLAAERREGVIANDYRAWRGAHPHVLKHTRPGCAMSAPIVYQDQLIGAITLAREEGGRPFTQTDLDLLTLFADEAAIAIQNARLYQEVAEREARLQELVGQLLLAHEEERRRVAHEVRDGLAQLAAGAHQHLQAFAHFHAPRSRQARQELEHALELARRTVGEARRIIAGLRPTVLDDFGLAAAVRVEVEGLQAAGWAVGYQENLGAERLPATIETTLFRVAQEALANARKHAGTTRADVSLWREGDTVRVEVRDAGAGFRPSVARAAAGPGERLGLLGMSERVALVGGRLTVRSRPGAGTRVIAEVPVPSYEGAEDGG